MAYQDADTSDITVYGVRVGRGAGAVSTNTAVGASALNANTTGATNTALGYQSLQSNTTASNNTAVGLQSLLSNTTASNNTAVGYQAGYAATVGGYSTFVGCQSGLSSNFTSDAFANNTFIGALSGSTVTTGRKNTILGLYNGNQGGLDIRTASNYIVLSDGDGNPRGYSNNNGYWYFAGGLNSSGVYSTTTASAANVFITSGGELQRSTSALKYKQDIRDLESLDITKFRPVRYKSKCDGDDQTKDHFGVIADEAADAGFEELVTRGADGEVEGFQYERLTVVLLKAIQTMKSELDSVKAELAALKGA